MFSSKKAISLLRVEYSALQLLFVFVIMMAIIYFSPLNTTRTNKEKLCNKFMKLKPNINIVKTAAHHFELFGLFGPLNNATCKQRKLFWDPKGGYHTQV